MAGPYDEMENMDGEAWPGRKIYFGQPLDTTGSVINGSQKTVTDGPFTEGKEIVGGYLMIRANDQAEAIELSKGCPLLEHEGIVEVREIKQMAM